MVPAVKDAGWHRPYGLLLSNHDSIFIIIPPITTPYATYAFLSQSAKISSGCRKREDLLQRDRAAIEDVNGKTRVAKGRKLKTIVNGRVRVERGYNPNA